MASSFAVCFGVGLCRAAGIVLAADCPYSSLLRRSHAVCEEFPVEERLVVIEARAESSVLSSLPVRQ